VAVLAVLLFHGEVSAVSGGFLGVDIFFVLSGFLITALLLTEFRAWGSIDLWSFWLRRARRLLPALFLVLVAVAVYGAVFVASSRLDELRGDAVATLAYVANWRFVASGQTYFDMFREPSPLLHMWSLGIEEQFYWLFPPLLAAWLHYRRRSRGLVVVFASLAVLSALEMWLLYHPASGSSRVYYGTDTRAQALFVGASLAALRYPDPDRLRRFPPPASRRAVSDMVGLACLVALLLVVNRTSEASTWLYHGGFLLVAVLTAGVIWACQDPSPVVSRVLSFGPLRLIGLVSYGLYLWHWPIFVLLSEVRTGWSGFPLLLVRLMLTFSMAALSYRLVEHPIRSGALRRHLRPVTLRALAGTTTAAVLVTVLAGTSGASASPPLERSGTFETRVQQPSAGQMSVLLAGDSPGRFLGWYFPPGQNDDLALSTATMIGCGLVQQSIVVGDVVTPSQPQCDEWPSVFRQAARATKPDVVVLSTGAWEVFDHKVDGRVLRSGTPAYANELVRQYTRAIGALAGTDKPVALLNVPCFDQATTRVSGVDLAPDHNDARRQHWLNSVLQRVADEHPGQVFLLDLRGLLCPQDTYTARIDGVDVRPDGVHVGGPGGKFIWSWLAPQLRRIRSQTADSVS
jgi:peptidoglycan/LPS O-acetylase OafA/YrhL